MFRPLEMTKPAETLHFKKDVNFEQRLAQLNFNRRYKNFMAFFSLDIFESFLMHCARTQKSTVPGGSVSDRHPVSGAF